MENSYKMFRKENPDRYVERKELLGMGSFGAVYKGLLLKTPAEHAEVAVKVISYNGDELTQLGRELYFLKNLSSPFIVKYVDSFVCKDELSIVMELCDSGSLLDICQATKATLSEAELKATMACCILGLLHIHERRSIHRDIKAGNILLSSKGKAMLSDFGVSTQLTDTNRRRTVIGTPYWMAPEILQETSYGENADIWSLGITIIECAQGSPPYFDAKPLRAMYMIASKPAPTLQDPSSWSLDMVDFLDKCLQKDPYQRAHSSDLEKHTWIQDELKEIRASEKAGGGATLEILRSLSRTCRPAIAEMRRARHQSSEDGTFQSFAAKVDDINTMETETMHTAPVVGIAGSTWRTDTMQTEARGATLRKFSQDDVGHLDAIDVGFDHRTTSRASRLSAEGTWNANTFNATGFSTARRGSDADEIGSVGMLSNASTPENTTRKQLASSVVSQVQVPAPAASSRHSRAPIQQPNARSGTVDTLRKQLGTLRLSDGKNMTLTKAGNRDTMNTLRNQLDQESRNLLRSQLSRSNGDNNNDDNDKTLKNELDPESRAALRSQLKAAAAAAAAGPGDGPQPSVREGGGFTRARSASVPEQRDEDYPMPIAQSAGTNFHPPTAPSQRPLPSPTNEGVNPNEPVGGKKPMLSLSRPATNISSLPSYQNEKEPFLVVRKYDSNASILPEDDFPPLAPQFAILTSQEGNVRFDNHEIQFRMAIYGANGKSEGCRMEIRFGHIDEINTQPYSTLS